jgi:hypothetical protein
MFKQGQDVFFKALIEDVQDPPHFPPKRGGGAEKIDRVI